MKRILIALMLAFMALVVCVVLYFISTTPPKEVNYIHNQGETQGTTYSITYLQPNGIDLQAKIEERLAEFDLSLSTYNPNSIISRINKNDSTVVTDSLFETMFNEAQKVAKNTNGALDITVGPLVKAWGFSLGGNTGKIPNVKKYKSLIGYNKVRIQNHRLIKENADIVLDANSIAQGYSVDVIAKLLSDNGCKNYMVEIGGEVACKGLNPKSQKWRIGINKAIDNTEGNIDELQTVLSVTNCAITTAGGYRKYFIKDGKKYPHIINPHTGYPIETNLLSVTIVAPTALMADAYDTPFMVMGVDSSLEVCSRIPGMECYLIYRDSNGDTKSVYSKGFKKYLPE